MSEIRCMCASCRGHRYMIAAADPVEFAKAKAEEAKIASHGQPPPVKEEA